MVTCQRIAQLVRQLLPEVETTAFPEKTKPNSMNFKYGNRQISIKIETDDKETRNIYISSSNNKEIVETIEIDGVHLGPVAHGIFLRLTAGFVVLAQLAIIDGDTRVGVFEEGKIPSFDTPEKAHKYAEDLPDFCKPLIGAIIKI